MQRFCQLLHGLYGYDTVWSAKRISPSRATVRHFLFYDVDGDAARGEATGGRRRFAFDCSLPPVADYEQKQDAKKRKRKKSVWMRDWLQSRVLAVRSV